MAQKIFKRGFANKFSGIDGQMAAIETDGEAVNRAVNLEMAVGNSLRGRVGCQTSGSYGFFGIFPYNYTRTQDQYDILYTSTSIDTTKTTADGASIQKLVAINQQLWQLDNLNITITQTNAGTYTWYSYVNGSNINLNILKNGVSILDTSLGDGVTSNTSTYSLLGTIDALADLAVSRTTRGTCPPFAIINGAQTSVVGATASYGLRYTFTVLNTPHNFKPGDIVTAICTDNVLRGGIVLSVTATTIVYVGPQMTVADGLILGYMGQSAATFPVSTISSESAGVFTLTIPYWRLVPEGTTQSALGDYGNLFLSAMTSWSNRTTNSYYALPSSVGASGNLYIATSGIASASIFGFANKLIKNDGLQPSMAGLPSATLTSVSTGVGALNGIYKYNAFFRRVDGQGNIVDGPLGTTQTITYVNNYGRWGGGSEIAWSQGYGFAQRGCLKYGAESPAAGVSFVVDDGTGAPGNNAFIQPGDVICLTDTNAQKVGLWHFAFGVDPVGTVHKTRCTFYDANGVQSNIKVADSSGYTIPDNSEISTGTTLVVLRTAAGGNDYYVLCEMPITSLGSVSFYDNVTDAVLTAGEQFTQPTVGKEHNPPPACSLVCQHQGGLVVARGPTSPNTVAFSTDEGIEYFPTASNSFDVPATQSGFITAIASDTDDRLAVFKERAYYDVVGDLDSGAFSVNVRYEGDYGITSQSSLVRVAGGLLGLSKNGFVTIQDGILDPYKFQEVNARLINQPYQYAWAMAANDYFSRNYVCTIPQVSGEPVSYVIDYSRGDIKVLERSYATKIDQAGGIAMVGDTMYHLSQTSPYGVFRRLIRFDSTNPSPTGNNGDSFIDNTGAISYILETNPINFGEPALLKTPIRIRIWSLPNDYVQEGWMPFSLLVETASSPIATYLGGSNPNSNSNTLTFAASTDVFKDLKLKNCKTHFYLIRFTTNTIRTAPFITGFEVMFAANYDKEDFVS